MNFVKNKVYFDFLHLFRLIIKGYKKPLEAQDLWCLKHHDQSHKIVPKLLKEWQKEQAKSQRSENSRATAIA